MIRQLLLLCLVASSASAQILDCTVSGELADEPGIERAELSYHLWAIDPTGKVAKTRHWDAVGEKIDKGETVYLNIEPDIAANVAWRRPVDPKFASVADVAATHALLAERLEPYAKAAVKSGSAIWTYRFFSPTYRRGEDIAGKNPQLWFDDLATVIETRSNSLSSLAKSVAATGGGELFEVYVPVQWNVDRPWAMAKCVLLLERQAATLEANGMRGIPLLNFYTVGVKSEPVWPDIMQALIFVAKQRGPIAIWNGWGDYDGGRDLPKITAEQKRWLK